MAEAIDYFLIQNLLNRYSDAVDRGDFDGVGEMFLHADVYFPGDATTKWVSFWDPAAPPVAGGARHTVAAPLDTIPVYRRA